jgi:hypothetical protein
MRAGDFPIILRTNERTNEYETPFLFASGSFPETQLSGCPAGSLPGSPVGAQRIFLRSSYPCCRLRKDSTHSTTWLQTDRESRPQPTLRQGPERSYGNPDVVCSLVCCPQPGIPWCGSDVPTPSLLDLGKPPGASARNKDGKPFPGVHRLVLLVVGRLGV